MKPSLFFSIPVLLAGSLSLSAGETTVLVDKDRHNGGFESEEIRPWFGNSDEPGVSREAGKVKEGGGAARIAITGKPEARATARLFQNVEATPDAGRYFTIRMDAAALPSSTPPSIHAEIVFFNGSEAGQYITFTQPETTPSEQWGRLELTGNTPAPEEWTGGRIQFRLVFYVDNSDATQTHELLVDNVELIQSDKAP